MPTPIDVLVVGAGPSGLTAAHLLALHGIRLRVIDLDSGPTDESRATVVHGRTLELWDKLELADKAILNGVKITGATLIRHGQVLARLPISGAEEGHRTPFPFSLIHEQSKTERLLLDALEPLGIRVEWNTEYLKLEQADEVVQVRVRSAEREEVIHARWVIACDGARSPIRHTLGIPFAGKTYDQVAFVADVDLETTLPRDTIHLNYFREGFVGFVPMRDPNDKFYRLIGTLPNDLEARVLAGELTDLNAEHLHYIFGQYLQSDVRIHRTHHTAIYRLHRRRVERYRVRRCFLVGDAAHVHSPAGGQGMNTGVGDAYNLAWKLALVVKGQAQPTLLESYEPERIAVAKAVLSGSDRGFGLEATKQPALQWFNNHLLPAFIRFGSRFSVVRRFAARAFSQSWINYRQSPAVSESRRTSGPARAGDRAPLARFTAGEPAGRTSFELLTGLDHHLLLFEGRPPAPGFALLKPALERMLGAYHAPVHIHSLSSQNRDALEAYGVKQTTYFLIRPDGHIAFRGGRLDLPVFESFLNHVFVRRNGSSKPLA